MKSDESPLAWLHRRGLIEPEAHQAGERLRLDWTLSHLESRITMGWAGAMTPGSGQSQPRDGLTTNERAIAARQRLAKALDAVGPELSGMLPPQTPPQMRAKLRSWGAEGYRPGLLPQP